MSVSSEVDICNLAISWVSANQIASLNDRTKEAQFCNRNYAALRDVVLEETDWSFSIKRTTLVPEASLPGGDGDWGYQYSFLLPGDCIRVVIAKDNSNLEVYDDSDFFWAMEEGRIRANVEKVYVRYVSRVTDTGHFSSGFVMALAARLAMEMALPIARSNGLHREMAAKYQAYRANAANSDGRQGRSEVVRSGMLTGVRRR